MRNCTIKGKTQMTLSTIDEWIDDRTEAMVELQKQLTSRPALNPETGGKGEWEKANFLENWLEKHGLGPARHFDTPDDRVPGGSRPNFIVSLGGQHGAPTTWVMTHLDVVPAGERQSDGTCAGWDSDPFTVRREGDRLYGRGVEDNQQSMVASIFAALAVRNGDLPPPGPVNLLFVSAEETGSEYGLKWLLHEHEDLFSTDDIILVPDGGRDDGTLIEIAEKSVLWVTFRIHGEQTHGSSPHLGRNAFRAGIKLAERLDEELHARFDLTDEVFCPPESTFEPTRHPANVPNVNTVPGKEVFSFDCRVLPDVDLDDVIECMRSNMREIDDRMGTETELELDNRLQAPPPTPHDAPAVGMLQEAIKDVYNEQAEPRGIGGSTVAAYFRQRGYPAVVWSRILATAHQANECCLIPNMVGDAKVFARIFARESR